MKRAVVLFSGGLDSTTCLAYALSQGFEVHALSFNYAQRHLAELEAAKRTTAALGVSHRVLTLPIHEFGNSALTDKNIPVPEYSTENTIPNTYVPARNTIFLSMALGLAEVLESQDIFIGISSVDYSGYPDCRPEYLAAFQTMANLATRHGVEGNAMTIHAPLMHLTKAQTIQMGHTLGVDYGLTVSCYQADEQGRACGKCESCSLRKKGFAEAGVPDPTRYAEFF
jgi:7-cyano-7-deazaguanine synthase